MFDIESKKYNVVRTRLLWDRGEKGIWRAGKFISFAEKTGQIFALGENMIKRVCEEMQIFTDKKVIMPLSGRLLLSYDFRNKIYDIFESLGVDTKRIIIEIDEKILMTDLPECSFVIEELMSKGLGFRVGRYGSGGMSIDILKSLKEIQISIPVSRLLEQNEPEEVIKYLKIVTEVANKLGNTVSFSDISDAEMENVVVSCGGRFVEGEYYTPLLTAAEIE